MNWYSAFYIGDGVIIAACVIVAAYLFAWIKGDNDGI